MSEDESNSAIVPSEVIDRDGSEVESDEPGKAVSDSDWAIGSRSCRAGLRRMLMRLAPDWSRVPEDQQPAYIKFMPSLRNLPHVRSANPASVSNRDKRRMVDEIADRVMHIMFCGSDENALKAAKLIFDSVDPPMKQSVGVEVSGSKLLVVPNDVADAI